MNETLWERIRDGDGAAFSELFDEYSDLIYNVAFRRTGSWDAAEKIVSLVFLEAWKQRATTVAGYVRRRRSSPEPADVEAQESHL